jgi:hypothetical protein
MFVKNAAIDFGKCASTRNFMQQALECLSIS